MLPIFVILAACNEPSEEKEEEVDYKEIRKELKATEVEVANAVIKDFEILVNTTGKIEADREVIIPMSASGLITKLTIKNGQRVQAGQILAEIENEKEQLNYTRAKYSLERAWIDFASDSIGYMGREFTEEIRNSLLLKYQIPSLQISLREAEIALEDKILRAPMSGVVANLEIREGGMAKAGSELCRIYEPNSLMLRAKILESDIALVRPGLEVDILPVSRSAGAYKGQVTEINPFVDENGMITVRIKVIGGDGLLLGMNANAIIKIPQTENIIVPKRAVITRSGGRSVVFTVENGRAKWNYVEVGLDNGQEIEVLEGIKAGDIVILTNNLQLAHDAAVSVVVPGKLPTSDE